jgi:hypothetical protein
MGGSLVDGVPVGQLEQRMWPGRWSAEGYLRQGDSLIEVMRADAATVSELTIDRIAVAARLQDLIERGAVSEWEPVPVGRWRVTVRRTRKLRGCPWAATNVDLCVVGAGAMRLSSDDFEITREGVREVIRGTGLCVHLIRDHGFFCGPGTPYRLDPAAAARVLDIGKEIGA